MSVQTETQPLICAKLYRPPATGALVPRTRLLERLERRRDRALTLIVAPAGYGKTTLVTSWLAAVEQPSAWLSLDEGDDLRRFLSYFVAAIETTFPEALGRTRALLGAASLPPQDILARSLINELDQIESPLILVLDDYHLIQNMAVHNLLTALLRYPPRAPHLVLASRSDPPLPLTSLRARGQVTEIRAYELRFTEAETAMLLQQMGLQVDQGVVKALLESTEGWVAGIRLAVLSSRHRGGVGLAPTRPQSSVLYVTDYLLTEVLDSQPPVVQDYLLRTSILDRFCASLCEAVCHGLAEATSGASEVQEEGAECRLSGQAYLEWLEGSDLFVAPLDDEHRWYRYHHMFQQLLRDQLTRCLGSDEIAVLHRRASAWFVQQGLIDEAIHHALEAGDELGAAQLVEQNLHALLNEDRWYILEQWLAKLPTALVQQRPQLLIARLWVAFFHSTLKEIPSLLERVESLLAREGAEAAQPLWGHVDFFWGQQWYWQGRAADSLERIEWALERIPEAHRGARGQAQVFWGLSAQMSGRKEELVRMLQQMLYCGQQPLHPILQLRAMGTLAFVHFLAGDLHQAMRFVLQHHGLATGQSNPYAQTWSLYMEAHCQYHWNDLEPAAQHFAQAVDQRYVLYTRAALDSLAGLALTYQALGREDQARAAMDLLLDFASESSDPAATIVARSCQARLALLRGDVEAAVGWLRMADLPTETGAMFLWLEIPQITQCRVLIAEGSAASLREAAEKLSRYRQANEEQHNTRQLLDILVLQALAHHKQGWADQALAILEEAITLAEPGGWVRPFVEPGPMMAYLLLRLKQRAGVPAHITRLLAAFPALVSGGAEAAPLIEPLTRREIEVLELLAQRLTNKEVAARLTISAGTVRQHTHNIYQKLGVRGRRQAVDRAFALGILSPPAEPSGRLFQPA